MRKSANPNLQLFSQSHTMLKTPQIKKSIKLTSDLRPPNGWHDEWEESETYDYFWVWTITGNDIDVVQIRTGYKFDLSDIPSYAQNITANIEAYRNNGAGDSEIVLIADDTDFSYVGGVASVISCL